MSIGLIFHRLAVLVGMVVLLFSGMFVILYVLRWEWGRALIAGVFFLGAEVFLATVVLLRRMASLERQVERSSDREQIEALSAMIRRSRTPTAGPFAWLTRDPDRTFVLVPILLGAGLILSGIAFVVERLSRISAAPVAEHELARGLSGMALPRAGLLPTGQAPAGLAARRTVSTGRRNAAVIAVLILAMLAVIFALIFSLITRPAPPVPGTALVVDVAVSTRRLEQGDTSVAASLWAVCQVRVPPEVELLALGTSPDDVGLQRLVVSPAPATFDEREFLGCLQDTVVDRALGQVVAVRRVAD